MFVLSYLAVLVIPLLVSSSPVHDDDLHLRHAHSLKRALPNAWHQARDHPAYSLFRRDNGDGQTYPAVGSPEWTSAYPPGIPDSTQMPQAWKDALAAAEAAGKIPNFAPTTLNQNGVPVYDPSINPLDPAICSGTAKCRNPADFWDAPTGFMGAGFDDGPWLGSPLLYSFLQANNIHATHFMIGKNILQNPQEFMTAWQTLGDDIAVHTWSHRYMTSLSNADVVAELGWSMEIIHNSTEGRLPRFWRPPMGDSDERVRAIANYIFGLETIFWNYDTNDWTMTLVNGTTPLQVNTSLTTWLTGPKSPGLIILEHELSNLSAQAFIDSYPDIVSNGWNLVSVATLVSGSNGVYQNSLNSGAPVSPAVNGIFNEALAASDFIAPSTTSSATSMQASETVVVVVTSSLSQSTSAPHSGTVRRGVGSSSLLSLFFGVIFLAII